MAGLRAAVKCDGVEAHGGVGFTWECDVQIWFERAVFDRTFLGGPSAQRWSIADALGLVVGLHSP